MPYSEKQIAELDAGMWAYEALKRADSGEQSLESAARTLIAAVRRETREECARVCDVFALGAIAAKDYDAQICGEELAEAIRNLQEREEK